MPGAAGTVKLQNVQEIFGVSKKLCLSFAEHVGIKHVGVHDLTPLRHCPGTHYKFVMDLRQHRTIPALRLKHRSGSCGTASALPKCSIMSGCGTRIVLRGQKPLALCDRCPCFGSLFPPLAALTFAASSIICAFGLAAVAPRSPYRHLELCGIALTPICRGRCFASSRMSDLAIYSITSFSARHRAHNAPPMKTFSTI